MMEAVPSNNGFQVVELRKRVRLNPSAAPLSARRNAGCHSVVVEVV